MDISFRRLTDDDLPLMHKWLNEPGVVKWWEGNDVSWDAVVSEYGSACEDPVEHWIAMRDGQSVGWIQSYALSDYPDEPGEWRQTVDPGTRGIDYLIGGPENRGQGLGAAMIQDFVNDIVFQHHPTVTQVVADPFDANVGSWKALANAGFQTLLIAPDPDGPCRVMSLRRH